MSRRYLLFVLAGVLTVCMGAKSTDSKSTSHTTLLADNQGKIRRLLLSFADYDIIPTLYGLLQNLNPDTTLSIVTPKGERLQILEALLRQWRGKISPKVELMTVDEPITFWVRDEFVSASGSTVVLPKRYGTHDMPEALERLTRSSKIKTLPSLIEFDGGNVVVGEAQVFIGYNMIRDNLGPIFTSEKEIVDYLQQLFGKPIVVVGNALIGVPHEHIDMLLTPLGGKRLLLGDPRLALEVLEKHKELLTGTYGKVYFNEATTPLPAAVKKLLFGSQEFVSRLQNELGATRSPQALQDSDVTLALLYAKNKLPANLKLFDDLAADLKTKGFHDIVRVPLLMNHDLENNLFITYNNLLLDMRDGGAKKIAYVPSYNLAPLDQLAQKTLEQAGFSVIPIDVQNISFYNGTLRCITQVLERTP